MEAVSIVRICERRGETRDLGELIDGLYGKGKRGPVFVTVLWVFADDSSEPGTPERAGQSVAVLAGYSATVETWDALKQEWVEILSDPIWPSPVAEFKMSDCVGGRNDFDWRKGWSRERRDELIGRLIRVILNPRYADLTGIGAGLILEDWEKEGYTREQLGVLAYSVVLAQLLHLAFKHAGGISEQAAIEGVECVLDTQAKVGEFVLSVFQKTREALPVDFRDKVNTPIFRDSKKYPHLQAADLLAYETYRHLYNWRFRREVGMGPRMRQLVDGRKHVGLYFSNEMITRYILLRQTEKEFSPSDLYRLFEQAES